MTNFDLRKYLAEGKLNEAMLDVATTEKVAQAIADAFTAEDNELDLKYKVTPGTEESSFDLDVEAGPNTPGEDWKDANGFSIDNYLGKYAGGSFYIKDGVVYNAASRNAPVANVSPEGEVEMISAEDSRAAIGMEENKKETKSNKMKKSELKEMIKSAFLNEKEEKVEEGTWSVLPDRIPEFIKAVEQLKDEYHAVVGSDDVFNGLDNAISAAEELLMNTAEVGDMPGFEGTRDALSNLGLEEAEEDINVEDEVDVDVEDTTVVDDEETTSDIEVKTSVPGENADVEAVQGLLTKAQQEAEALGDEKLMDQIGNTITYFTRTHVVKSTNEAEEIEEIAAEPGADGVEDVNIDNPAEDAMVGLTEEITRFKKLAGLK
jgi:hypothetical protein